MEKKRFLLIVIILLVSFYVTPGTVNVTDTRSVSDQVDVTTVLPSLIENASTNGSIISDNHTIILKNPTFEELKSFVLADTTHKHAFVPNEYECRHFATDMVNNATEKGILAGFVLICYSQWQHAAVAFNTIDRGLIYIEPQTNAAIDIKVGGIYQGQKIKQVLIAW